MRVRWILVMAVAAAAVAQHAAAERDVLETILVRVNDRIVTVSDFKVRLRQELAQISPVPKGKDLRDYTEGNMRIVRGDECMVLDNGDLVLVSATVTDVNGDYSFTDLEDGTYDLRIQASDRDGNESVVILDRFGIDTSPPALQVRNFPSDGIDPDDLAIAVALVDGRTFGVGQAEVRFPLMSISKPFTYALALEQRGADYMLKTIGVSATGLPYNSVTADSGYAGWVINATSPGVVPELQRRLDRLLTAVRSLRAAATVRSSTSQKPIRLCWRSATTLAARCCTFVMGISLASRLTGATTTTTLPTPTETSPLSLFVAGDSMVGQYGPVLAGRVERRLRGGP